jgi:sporulation protein YlmC with PRC-barrel domain
MTRKPNPSTLVLALLVALATPAAAADASRAAANPPSSSASRSDAPYEVRVSKLIGTDVHSPGGQKLGDIKDVIVDTNSGRLHYAILSAGGVLGVGDKLFAIPISQLRPDGKRKLVLDIDKERLKSAPAFENSRWPDWNTDPYRAEVDRRYSVAPAGSEARLRRASNLLKAEVRDANRADIGDIKDIVVDLRNGRVHYVVAEFNREWNPKDKLVALPMSVLSDGATAPPPQRSDDAAAPPRNPPKVLSLESPSGATKGPASATIPPGGVEIRPPAVDADGTVRKLDRQPLRTMTSYADDEDLIFKGTREQLRNAPAFDRKQYPDLSDPARRQAFERRLSGF